MTEHLDEAALGSGGALLVCGLAGTGRTSLLAEGAERARQRALRVASVRASSLETSLDGEVMHQLLGALGAQPGGREALLGAVGRRCSPRYARTTTGPAQRYSCGAGR